MAVRDMLRHFADSERIFASHIMDLFDQVQYGNGPRCTGFCNLRQAAIVRKIGQAYDVHICVEGGWYDAERVIFMLAQSEWELPQSPLCSILICSYGEVSHRDILGAVLALGVTREQVGDIIRVKDGHIIFTKHPANQIILEELVRVGREAVRCQIIPLADIPEPIRNFRLIKGTVKSQRLDSLVALCCGCSREIGKQLVEKDCVMVDAVLKNEPSHSVAGTCVLSIRGHGKFLVNCLDGVSAKGRHFVEIKKYL